MAAVNLATVWLVLSNVVTSLCWARVGLAVLNNSDSISTDDSVCRDAVDDPLRLALLVSFVEVFNSIAGFTRSPIQAVLLFSTTRFGVEYLVGPLISCGSWQHLLTICSWSIGDTVRFGCLAVATAYPQLRIAKSIRFTVGPVLFPIGAFGEMMMVVAAAKDGRPILYIAAALWPVFFYPMMQQLLKQRRKHFQEKKKQIKSV